MKILLLNIWISQEYFNFFKHFYAPYTVNYTALLGLIAHAEMSKVFAGQGFLGFHCTP